MLLWETYWAPQVLIKFKAEVEIHVMWHDCVRQRCWCGMSGTAASPAAADGCSLLTGWKTSAEMTTANDPSHRGTTEQRWIRDLSISLSVCLLSVSLSGLLFSSISPPQQSRSACQRDCLPSIFPPSIHPSLHPSIHPSCRRIQHPLPLSITYWLVWRCHSTRQSFRLHLPTYLSVCHSISVCMNELGWEMYCSHLHSKIRWSGHILVTILSFWGISNQHWCYLLKNLINSLNEYSYCGRQLKCFMSNVCNVKHSWSTFRIDFTY